MIPNSTNFPSLSILNVKLSSHLDLKYCKIYFVFQYHYHYSIYGESKLYYEVEKVVVIVGVVDVIVMVIYLVQKKW